MQMGFPVVTVSRNYTTHEIDFVQSRFTFVEEAEWKRLNIKFEKALWWIPLSYTTSTELNFSDTSAIDWIRGVEKATKQFDNLTEKDWVLVNIQSTGKSISL